MPVHVLHLSDLHARAVPGAPAYGHDPDRRLDAVLRAARGHRRRFDLVAVTGDIADDASPAAYGRVRDRLADMGDATRWVPGNHDDPQAMAAADPPACTSRVVGTWRFVGVSSLWPGRAPGRVSEPELLGLRRSVSASPLHHAVLIHHPPRPPCAHADCQIHDVRPLLETLDDLSNVRLVLSGHMHRSWLRHRGDVAWVGAPSTCMQVTHPDHTPTPEPPACNVLELGDDGSVVVIGVQGLDPAP